MQQQFISQPLTYTTSAYPASSYTPVAKSVVTNVVPQVQSVVPQVSMVPQVQSVVPQVSMVPQVPAVPAVKLYCLCRINIVCYQHDRNRIRSRNTLPDLLYRDPDLRIIGVDKLPLAILKSTVICLILQTAEIFTDVVGVEFF